MLRRRIDVVASWQFARQQFAAVIAERDQLKWELEWVERERDEFRVRLHELQSAVEARWKAEEQCRALYRERDLQRAMRMERDLTDPLH